MITSFCIAIISVFILMNNPNFAQKKIKIGLNISPQTTFLYENSTFKPEFTIKYTGGILIEYEILKNIYIITVINYSKQGQNFIYPYRQPFGETSLKIKLDYLKIPLIIDYMFINKDRFSFSLFVGGRFSYLIKSYDNFSDNYFEKIILPPTEYRKTDISSLIGFRYNYKISSSFGLNTKLIVEHGFKNIFINTEGITENEWVHFNNAKNNIISLSFGLTYSF